MPFGGRESASYLLAAQEELAVFRPLGRGKHSFSGVRSLKKNVVIGLAMLAAIAAIVFLIVTAGGKQQLSATQRTPGSCPGGHNVVLYPHAKARIMGAGLTAFDTGDLRAALKPLLNRAGHDPRIMVLLWNAQQGQSIKDWNKLTDGQGCYTLAAVEKYNRLLGAFDASILTSSYAPADGCNTGINDQGPFQVCGQISGDRTAIKVELPCKCRAMYIMRRCANPVTPRPIPRVPKKCPNGGATVPGRKPCGTPDSGPDYQPPQSNPPGSTAGTPGYTPDNAEKVTEAQPTSTSSGTDCGLYGCNTGGGAGTAPSGSTTSSSGDTTTGTDAGTTDPQLTEGSGQTSSGDPGIPP